MPNTETLTAMGEGHFDPEPKPTSMRLHLGCGYSPKEGWINVDRVARNGMDVMWDLNRLPWPWATSSMDEVESHHVIEHVDSLVDFLNEIHRVLKPGAKAFLTMPHGRSDRAWQDPTHKRALTEASFLYASKQWRDANGIDYAEFTCNFDPVTYGVAFAPGWDCRSDEARQFALTHYWNVALDLHVYLTAVK